MTKVSIQSVTESFDAEGRLVKERMKQAEKIGLFHASSAKINIANDALIEGLLDQGTLAMIYGQSNAGKSFVALDIAAHLSSGKKWLGREVKRSNVLFVALEGRRGLENRLVGLSQANKLYPNSGLICRSTRLNLFEGSADAQDLIDQANWVFDESPYGRAIFIDTMAMAAVGASENDGRDMGIVLEKLRWIKEETDAMIMLVHHVGKDASKGARGHSSIRATLDTELELMTQGGNRYLKVTKQREYEKGGKIPFSLETISLLDTGMTRVTTKIVQPADTTKLSANDAIVSLLKEAAMPSDKLYEAFKAARNWSNAKSQFNQALTTLKEKSVITEDEGLLKLT